MRRRIERDYNWTGSTWAKTNEVHFIYDGNVVIQERDANNLPKVTYTRGNDLSGTLQGAGGIGGLLARSDNTQMAIGSSSAHTYYHSDGNGNVTMLINNLQLVQAKYLYDPFGNTLSMSGPLASANVYRFSSKEWNASSGLYYYLYRFYDPNLQRWLNRDPLGDVTLVQFLYPKQVGVFSQDRHMIPPREELSEPNLYMFVANSPVSGTDPFGLCHCDQAGCAAAIGDAAIAYAVAALACAEKSVKGCWTATLAADAAALKAWNACDDCGVNLGPVPRHPPTWHPVFPVP
jgi:RHS repeat-associated protein